MTSSDSRSEVNREGEEYIGKQIVVRVQAYITGKILRLRDDDATNNLIFSPTRREFELTDDDGVLLGYLMLAPISMTTGIELSSYEIVRTVDEHEK